MQTSIGTPRRASGAIAIALALIVVFATVTACGEPTPQMGVVTGQVTIAPISPVEEEGAPAPTAVPQLLERRVIVIYGPDGEEVIKRAEIDVEGVYREELPPGTYIVDIERMGPVTAAEVPETIQIASGETVQLDITIDTGIR